MKFVKHKDIVILILWCIMIVSCKSPIGKIGAHNHDAVPLISGYTCCNLRHEGGDDWINELNYVSEPMILFGTPVSVIGYEKNLAHINLNGKLMRLGQDYTREELTLEQYVKRVIVPEDPGKKLVTYPRKIQDAIILGKVMNGMTKEQVIMSVGYPLTQENPDMNAPMWRMWIDSFKEYQLMWDKNGKVKAIIADPVTKSLIVYKPNY